mgnify:CR=1 FL=1
MRMMSLSSGSSGNCIYVGSENTHILIDVGISRKAVLEGLDKLDLSLDDIDAILITHEHDDHIKGLGVIERCRRIPVFSAKGTIDYLEKCDRIGRVPEEIYNSFIAGDSFTIGDLEISSTKISHDAADPVAYVAGHADKRAGVLTDLGKYDDSIVKDFKNLDAMVLESNHDVNMLLNGPYTYPLKQRIIGDKGHLSNESCGRLLCELLNDHMRKVLLGHLSRENNFPELAYETVKCEINLGDNEFKASDFDISVAPRNQASDIINF